MHAHADHALETLHTEPGRATLDPEALARANINPRTRLATDYLNHFNEVVMLLELLPGAPEFAADIVAWRPLNYHDYFVASHFKDRELALLAFDAADPIARQSLEELVAAMNEILLATLALLRNAPSADTGAAHGPRTAAAIKPLLARAGAIINAQDAAPIEVADEAAAQAMADAVFEQFTP